MNYHIEPSRFFEVGTICTPFTAVENDVSERNLTSIRKIKCQSVRIRTRDSPSPECSYSSKNQLGEQEPTLELTNRSFCREVFSLHFQNGPTVLEGM